MNNLLIELEKNFPQMVEWRRHFHMYPELSFQEVETPKKIAQCLTEFGIEVRTGVGGRGVVGLLKGAKPGKTVALRADFDALPIQDEKEVAYKSTIPGVMHACGHDAHTATLLTIAKVLAEHRDSLCGNVVFIHQFAEELAPGGAKAMIEDGALEGVDVIFGTHLWSQYPSGSIGITAGPMMAAADRFRLKFLGKGGHGAMPHQTIDAILLGSQFVQQVQQIISRRINPLKSAVLTIGSFHAGNAFNIIADTAELLGTVRTFDEEVRQQIVREIEDVARSVSQTFGGDYRYEYQHGYPAVINHAEESKFIERIAASMIGEEHVFTMEPLMVSEDFAYYLQKVPGAFFMTGSGNEQYAATYPHHHPKFDIDESAMLIAAKTLATATVTYLAEH